MGGTSGFCPVCVWFSQGVDCLVFEMLYIKKLKPCLNTQTDSIRAKLFV